MKNKFGELLQLIKDDKIDEFIEKFPCADELSIAQLVKLKLLSKNEKIISLINDFITKKYKID